MLRLSNGKMPTRLLSADLQVNPQTVKTRLHRLELLGAVKRFPESDTWSLRSGAHQIIMNVASTGLNQYAQARSSRDEVNLAARRSRFQSVDMFRTLPTDELDWLARVSRTQQLTAGEVLILEGDVCDALYIVDSGTIRLSKSSTSSGYGFGREQTIHLMLPGDSFNEVPVFDDGPNPVTAEGLDESTVIVVPKKAVQMLAERSPIFAGAMLENMSKRIRHMLAMVEDVSMRDVTGRVAKILLQVHHPTDGVGAGLRTGRRLTQREIAEMAGTAREVVARVLKKMERSGALKVNRGKVEILDPELLESLT